MAEVSFEAWRGGAIGDNGCPSPLPHPPQDTRGRGEEESRGRKETNKGGEERRGLKTLTRRYPASQGRRITEKNAGTEHFGSYVCVCVCVCVCVKIDQTTIQNRKVACHFF